MRSPSHRFRRIFRAKPEAKAKSENRPRCRAKSESRPRWKNPDLGRAPMPGRRGRASMGPRSHLQKKKACCSPPPTRGLEFFLGRIPTLARAWQGSDAGQARPGGYAYVLYVLYLTRQATEHPLSPGPCYMCYMCYISQGKPLNIHSPGFFAICAICAIWPCIAHIVQK